MSVPRQTPANCQTILIFNARNDSYRFNQGNRFTVCKTLPANIFQKSYNLYTHYLNIGLVGELFDNQQSRTRSTCPLRV